MVLIGLRLDRTTCKR